MLKLLFFLTYVSFCIGGLEAVRCDLYSGKPATEAQLKKYAARNNTGNCTIEVKLPCDPNEWKRLDGSCNNLNNPARATHFAPTIRFLEPDFTPNYEPRKAANGNELPLERKLRTQILQTGKVSDLRVTQLLSYYLLFMLGDVNSIHDIINYVRNFTVCCKPEYKNDYRCISPKIPIHDPVHRFSGIHCMNLTRPISYQYYGCRDNGTKFTRYIFQTPVFDLSNIYNFQPGFNVRLRTYKNGLMKEEKENGLYFPPTDPNSDCCFLNQPPRETRCNMYHANIVLGANLFIVLFYLQHNQIAERLHKLNPCWSDERLFYTAREINIAISLQIYLYELLPVVFGKDNMIRDGTLSCDGDFRNLYNEHLTPAISDEYTYALRWFHTMQETEMKFYDKDGYFTRTEQYANLTTRTGYLAAGTNMLEMIQGSFRQAGGGFDHVIEADMADRVLGGMNLAADVATSDLRKGRFFGFPSYTRYKELCKKWSHKRFPYLEKSFSPERWYRLKQVYKNESDIDLMSALWAERHIKGGRVPQTLYCLVTHQLQHSIASDRHWFERPNRPHAFTRDQLKAIRKVTIAGMLCSIGKFVKEIQPHAFYTIFRSNPLTKCSSSKIGKIDLAPWKDHKCSVKEV